MATRVGVGFSENSSSEDCGREAARLALDRAETTQCDLAILFSTSKHDPIRLRDGVRSVIGADARLIGGYSNGIITSHELGYDGYQAGVAVMKSDSVDVDLFIEKGLPGNERNVGRRLGEQISSRTFTGAPNVVLMYDFVKGPPAEGMSWNINWATPLLEGLGESLGSWPPAAGMALMGDWQCNPTYQWFDDRVERHSAMALVLSGGVRMDTVIMHGCRPSSPYHRVSEVDQNVILGIDGRPAVDVIADMLGPEGFKTWVDYPFFITLGLNRGDKFGPFKEENYANRLVAGLDKARGGLIMFEPDITVGTEVQLMRRTTSDFGYVRERTTRVLESLADRRPFFALYIDCAGRASAYSGTEGEEAEEVQAILGSHVPILGMYSGAEIAKVGEGMQSMVWTGVLCVFSE